MESSLDDNTKFKQAFNELYLYAELKKDVEFVTPIGDINRNSPLMELTGGNIPGINTSPQETVDVLSDALTFTSLTSFYRRTDMQTNQARYKAYEVIPFPKLNMFSSYTQNRIWNRIDNFEEFNLEEFPSLISILNKEEYWRSDNLRSTVRYKSTEPLGLVLNEEEQKAYTKEFKFDPKNKNVSPPTPLNSFR